MNQKELDAIKERCEAATPGRAGAIWSSGTTENLLEIGSRHWTTTAKHGLPTAASLKGASDETAVER